MSDTPTVLRSHDLPIGIGPFAPDPPSRLVPESYAAQLYAMMAPIARLDSQVGWSLLIFCNALGTMFQLVDEWVRDSPEGPGWSPLLDLGRCPDVALPWLGQLVGVRLPPGLTPAEQRQRIASTDGFRRGTPDAIRNAAWATLTGNRTVILYERSHDPADTPDYAYYLHVVTYQNQTPDPEATLAAIMAQKPGGSLLTYLCQLGQNYQQVFDRFPDYATVQATYPDYATMLADQPELGAAAA